MDDKRTRRGLRKVYIAPRGQLCLYICGCWTSLEEVLLPERRRVYTELGLMAEAERVRQHCPFRPQLVAKVVTGAGADQSREENDAFSRLHQDAATRKQRKEGKIKVHLQQRPDFRPRLLRKNRTRILSPPHFIPPASGIKLTSPTRTLRW